MSLSNVKHIVLVLSGKGGVGKSSITTQLALSLSLAGKTVGILDIDLTGPSIPRLLGLESARITQAPGGWLPCLVHPAQTLPPLPPQLQTQPQNETHPTSTTANGRDTEEEDQPTEPLQPKIGALHALSLALLLPSRSSAIIWRGPKKTAMVRQFLTDALWPALDYLLIDTPPGTSDEHIALAETLLASSRQHQLAGAVIVTTPQAVAVSDVRKEVNFCRKVGVRVLGVVENMSGFVCECCGEEVSLFGKGGGEVMAGEFGVVFLGRVPVDAQWGVLVEEGGRPEYREVGVVKGDGGMGDSEGEEEEEGREEDGGEGIEEGRGKEEGLLVDRYRSCALSGVFEGITKHLVNIVEG